jgi:hypothetical protein
LIITTLIVSLFAVPAGAQTASIRLEGIVWDPTGEPLSDVGLTAIDEETGRQIETVSDSEGYYRFLALPPGVYTVTAKAKGFKDVVHRNKRLFSPESAIENFSFEVSAIEKELTPSETPKVNDSATSGSFSRRELDSLPLLNRNPFTLLIYEPGVQISAGSESESTVNGARKMMNRITLDGLSISDPTTPIMGSSLLTTTPDTIADMQMFTSGAKAEYGESGGGQFVLASRAGAKTWSGEAYDYFRTRLLNANEFFTNTLNFPRPGLASNIFGLSVTGPIGEKTRIFGNFEGNLTDQQLIENRLVLTDSAKTGIFKWFSPDDSKRTDETMKSFNIAANDPRGLGIDSSIAAILEKLPEPNNKLIGDYLNLQGYRFDVPVDSTQNRVDVRLDHSLKANHQLFFHFNMGNTDSTDTLNGAEATYPGEQSGRYLNNTWTATFGSDWILSPRKVNELRIGYIHPKAELKRPARLTTPMYLANSWSNPLDTSFPRTNKFPAFEIVDNFSQSMNRHSLKYGASFRRAAQDIVDYSGLYPNITFGRDINNHGNIPDSSVGPSEQTEISESDRIRFENLYNDLLGRIESVSQTFYSKPTGTLALGTPRNRNFATNGFSAFVQDDWKIRRNLTLNLGLRYEVRTSPRERDGLQSVLDKASRINASAQISNFSIAAKDKWYSTDMGNLAPRIGFSWDINGSGNTVLRGAYGVYYDHINGAITDFVDRNSPGLSKTVSVYPNLDNGDVRLSDGIPIPAAPGVVSTPSATRSQNVAVLNPNLKTPRVDQFNIMLEKKFLGVLLEVGYTATRGKDLFQYTNLNQTKTRGDFLQAFNELKDYRDNGTPVPQTNTLAQIFGSPMAAFYFMKGSNFDSGEVGAAADQMDLNYYGNYDGAGVSEFYIRNFPQFDKFYYGSNTAKSWYDSFQFGIRKTTNHLNLRVFYTWSKSLDTMSSDGDSYVAPSDSFQTKINKAPSDFDRRHVLNAAWNYAIPYGRTRNPDSESPKWIGGLLGGWNFGALLVKQSGQRFTVTTGLQHLFSGVSSTANLDTGDTDTDSSEKHGSRSMGAIYKNSGNIYWFNPTQAAYFTNPGAGEVGSSGRNSFIGPHYFNMDAVLHKKFYLNEDKYLQLRIEGFNVFNNTHYGLPGTNLNSGDFGIITRTIGSPRSLQVALRLKF